MSFASSEIEEASALLEDYCLSEQQTKQLAKLVLSELGYIPNQDEEPENSDSVIFDDIVDRYFRQIGKELNDQIEA